MTRTELMVVAALVWSWALPAQAACDLPSTAVDVIESSENSASAYENADLTGFMTTTSELEAKLACLQEPLPRNVIAGVHRMMGLRAFVDQKPEKAQQAFGAARSIESAYRFPETMVPPGHPIMSAYEALDVSEPVTKDVPTAENGYFQFDGRPTQSRPISLPTVVQLFNAEGAVEVSAYIWPEDGMLDYEQGTPTLAPGVSPVVVDGRPKGPNLPLAVGAGAAALLSGVAYGLASSAQGQFNDPAASYDDGAALRSKTNTFIIVSGGAGAAAVGLGVGAVVAGRW